MTEHGIVHSRSQGLIDAAYRFAKEAHGDQKRKYTGEPYIVHPVAVAKIVASVTEDCAMIAAALLHDVIEDTPVTFEELSKPEHGFMYPVAHLVLELSDVSKPEDGNRAIRKKIDLDHLSGVSPRAKTIKLADLIHNTSSICKYDPGFARLYMAEKRALLGVLTEGNMILHNAASQLVEDYYVSISSQKI